MIQQWRVYIPSDQHRKSYPLRQFWPYLSGSRSSAWISRQSSNQGGGVLVPGRHTEDTGNVGSPRRHANQGRVDGVHRAHWRTTVSSVISVSMITEITNRKYRGIRRCQDSDILEILHLCALRQNKKNSGHACLNEPTGRICWSALKIIADHLIKVYLNISWLLLVFDHGDFLAITTRSVSTATVVGTGGSWLPTNWIHNRGKAIITATNVIGRVGPIRARAIGFSQKTRKDMVMYPGNRSIYKWNRLYYITWYRKSERGEWTEEIVQLP